MNYQDALDFLAAGRDKNWRKYAHNTWIERIDESRVGIVYHRTTVVTLHADGSIQLNSGGWRTYTTKVRMNYVCCVWQENHEWFASTRGADSPKHDFEDGMILRPDGTAEYPSRANLAC